MKFDVVTFGSATVDFFADTADSDVIHMGSEDVLAYHAGDKVLLKGFSSSVGGGGCNTAACFSSLGFSTAYGGAIGRDHEGDMVLDELRKKSISFVGPRVDVQTNTSIVLNSASLNDRTILAYKGASNELLYDMLNPSVLHAQWWYSSSLVGHSFQTLLSLAQYAKQHGILFACNPSAYQTQLGLDVLSELISLCSLFVLNKQEAEMLVGQGSREELCIRLHKAGASSVCVTEGSHGASLLHNSTIVHCPSSASVVRDTTGAGDCFASTIVSCLMRGVSVEDILVYATVHAHSVISRVGAHQGLLSWDELQSRVLEKKISVLSKKINL